MKNNYQVALYILIVVGVICTAFAFFTLYNKPLPASKAQDVLDLFRTIAEDNDAPYAGALKYAVPVGISQTRDGFTLTIAGAYANNIERAVFFLIQGNGKSSEELERLAENLSVDVPLATEFVGSDDLSYIRTNFGGFFCSTSHRQIKYDSNHDIIYGVYHVLFHRPLRNKTYRGFSVKATPDKPFDFDWFLSVPGKKFKESAKTSSLKTVPVKKMLKGYFVEDVIFTPMTTRALMTIPAPSQQQLTPAQEDIKETLGIGFGQHWSLITSENIRKSTSSSSASGTSYYELMVEFSPTAAEYNALRLTSGIEFAEGWEIALQQGEKVETPYGIIEIEKLISKSSQVSIEIGYDSEQLIYGETVVFYVSKQPVNDSTPVLDPDPQRTESGIMLRLPASVLSGEYRLQIVPIKLYEEIEIDVD